MPRRIVAPGRSTGALSRAQLDDPGRRHRRAHRIRPGPAKPARAGPPRRGSPTPRRRTTSATQTGLLTAVAAQGYDLLTDALTAQRPGTSSTSGWPTCASPSTTAPTSRSCSAPDLHHPNDPAVAAARHRAADALYGGVGTVTATRRGPNIPRRHRGLVPRARLRHPLAQPRPPTEPRRRPPSRRPQRRRDPVPRPTTAGPVTGVRTANRPAPSATDSIRLARPTTGRSGQRPRGSGPVAHLTDPSHPRWPDGTSGRSPPAQVHMPQAAISKPARTREHDGCAEHGPNARRR